MCLFDKSSTFVQDPSSVNDYPDIVGKLNEMVLVIQLSHLSECAPNTRQGKDAKAFTAEARWFWTIDFV